MLCLSVSKCVTYFYSIFRKLAATYPDLLSASQIREVQDTAKQLLRQKAWDGYLSTTGGTIQKGAMMSLCTYIYIRIVPNFTANL